MKVNLRRKNSSYLHLYYEWTWGWSVGVRRDFLQNYLLQNLLQNQHPIPQRRTIPGLADLHRVSALATGRCATIFLKIRTSVKMPTPTLTQLASANYAHGVSLWDKRLLEKLLYQRSLCLEIAIVPQSKRCTNQVFMKDVYVSCTSGVYNSDHSQKDLWLRFCLWDLCFLCFGSSMKKFVIWDKCVLGFWKCWLCYVPISSERC